MNAVRKHGRENFKKEIICSFDDIELAYFVESQYVTDVQVEDRNCYNIKLGGYGGFDHIKEPWNKRISPSKESRDKMSASRIGHSFMVEEDLVLDQKKQKEE